MLAIGWTVSPFTSTWAAEIYINYALTKSEIPVMGLLNYQSLRHSDLAIDRSVRI